MYDFGNYVSPYCYLFELSTLLRFRLMAHIPSTRCIHYFLLSHCLYTSLRPLVIRTSDLPLVDSHKAWPIFPYSPGTYSTYTIIQFTRTHSYPFHSLCSSVATSFFSPHEQHESASHQHSKLTELQCKVTAQTTLLPKQVLT